MESIEAPSGFDHPLKAIPMDVPLVFCTPVPLRELIPLELSRRRKEGGCGREMEAYLEREKANNGGKGVITQSHFGIHQPLVQYQDRVRFEPQSFIGIGLRRRAGPSVKISQMRGRMRHHYVEGRRIGEIQR